jgi:hypothetical protein
LRDGGVSSVLGTLLMLALMMTLIPGVLMLRAAWSSEMEAQREAAETAAYCARNPAVGPPTCAERTVLQGYACHEVGGGTFLCAPKNATAPPTPPTIP